MVDVDVSKLVSRFLSVITGSVCSYATLKYAKIILKFPVQLDFKLCSLTFIIKTELANVILHLIQDCVIAQKGFCFRGKCSFSFQKTVKCLFFYFYSKFSFGLHIVTLTHRKDGG